MSKFYIASRSSRQEEMRGYAEELKELGHLITSTWLYTDLVDEEQDEDIVTEQSTKQAEIDFVDVLASDSIAFFSEMPRAPTRGGRFVELGAAMAMMALAKGRKHYKVYAIGPKKENVFLYLPVVEAYASWEAFRDVIKARGEEARQPK